MTRLSKFLAAGAALSALSLARAAYCASGAHDPSAAIAGMSGMWEVTPRGLGPGEPGGRPGGPPPQGARPDGFGGPPPGSPKRTTWNCRARISKASITATA